MDTISIFAISGLLAVVTVAVFVKNRKTRVKEDIVAQAKERAARRVNTRAFADTEPAIEWTNYFDVEVETIILSEKHDGPSILTPKEKEIINSIMGDIKTEPSISPVPPKEDPWKRQR